MSLPAQTAELLKRSPALGPLLYAAALLAMLVVCVEALSDVGARLGDLSADRASLMQLKSHAAALRAPQSQNDAPRGSPFIEAPTVTIAGAALLERVSSAVTHVEGEVLSSQVDLKPLQGKSATIKVTVETIVDQPSLQKLLYDLEAGMPFLYVDRLDAETSDPVAGARTERLHVLLAVHGQWMGQP